MAQANVKGSAMKVTNPAIYVADHYVSGHLKDIGIHTSADLLREWEALCKPGCDWPFCFFSTSGVHGSYTDLDTIDEDWGEHEVIDGEPIWKTGDLLTVVLYKPRLVSTYRGQIKVAREDIPALRDLCVQSIKNVISSQMGNLPQGSALEDFAN